MEAKYTIDRMYKAHQEQETLFCCFFLICIRIISSLPFCSGVRVAQSLVFCVVFCRHVSFCRFFRLAIKLSVLRITITPLVSRNFSYGCYHMHLLQVSTRCIPLCWYQVR